MLERIQRDGGVSVAELARDHAVSRDHGAPRPRAARRARASSSACTGAPGRSRGPAPARAADRDGLVAAGRAGRRRPRTAIAARAATLVPPGSTIFLDASSTALCLARRLMEDPPNELTLVTSSPAIAYEMQAEPVHVVVAPGELDQHMRMLAGRWTVEFLAQLNFDTAFVSAAGITLEEGLTTSRRPLADVVNARALRREAHGGADRREQVRPCVAADDHARGRPRPDHHRRRPRRGGRRARTRRRRPPGDRPTEGGSMSRPVTLFTGQWADLHARGARREVRGLGLRRARARLLGRPLRRRRGAERPRLLRRAARDPRAPRPGVLGDRQPPRRPGRMRPDRRAPQGGAAARRVGRRRPEGVRAAARPRTMKDTARAAAQLGVQTS